MGHYIYISISYEELWGVAGRVAYIPRCPPGDSCRGGSRDSFKWGKHTWQQTSKDQTTTHGWSLRIRKMCACASKFAAVRCASKTCKLAWTEMSRAFDEWRDPYEGGLPHSDHCKQIYTMYTKVYTLPQPCPKTLQNSSAFRYNRPFWDKDNLRYLRNSIFPTVGLWKWLDVRNITYSGSQNHIVN